MRVSLNFTGKDNAGTFRGRCETAIRNVGRGTKKATEEACMAILEESLRQVPRASNTLAISAFYEVRRRSDTSINTWAYEGTVGYGGNGDPINPTTGCRASEYMTVVHEDLSAWHVVGKAKFLEDPVRKYAEENFSRTVFKYASESLADMQ